ncbi:ArdC family protein [Rhizobium beringeri]
MPYHSFNIIMRWAEAMDKGYSAPIRMIFKQAEELGASMRKSERGSLVVYANTLD